MNYRKILEDFVNNENTEYCYDWQGFNYEIILPCIEQLLKNENNLQSKIDKATKKADELRKYIYRELVDFNVCGSTEAHCLAKDLLDILKEAENVENN